MKEKIFFYRAFCLPDFVQRESEKAIIPVRVQNQYIPKALLFEGESPKECDSLPAETEVSIPEEFVERPVEPKAFYIKDIGFFPSRRHIDIEDFSPSEMQDFLDWRVKQQRWKINERYFLDKKGIRKDYVAAIISIDRENLTLDLAFRKFASLAQSDMPTFVTEHFFFDIKKGFFSSSREGVSDERADSEDKEWNDISLSSQNCSHDDFDKAESFLKSRKLPANVLETAYQKITELASSFTKLSLSNSGMGKNASALYAMLLLTMLPFEPKLFPVLVSMELEKRKFRFRFKRNDSKVFNHFCRKARIKPYRVLRKCYGENPKVLLAYMKLHDGHFRDVNLYNRVIENKENYEIIKELSWESMAFFARYSIRRRGQLATLNTLLRDTPDSDPFDEKADGLDMFHKYFRHVPKKLRKDILTDGFTKFNHDALSNLSYTVKNKKIVFKYTEEQKKLEDEIDGYIFRLPQTSYQMCEIGTALHNCVASYANSVRDKECTIVYAKKDDSYSICIEVRKNEVRQERIDRNAYPSEEQKKVLYKWHERHGLKTAKES